MKTVPQNKAHPISLKHTSPFQKAAKTGLYIEWESDLGASAAPEWLIKSHIIKNTIAMLYGPSGVGKSFVALDMGLAIAAGKPWQGHETHQGAVLYVAGEGLTGINNRRLAWRQANKIADDERIPFAITSQPVPLLDVQRANELVSVIGTMPEPPSLIIVDTVNRNFGDGDENNTKDMSRFVDALKLLQVITGACVMAVHHTGKGESQDARGSSALRAAMDTELALRNRNDGIQLIGTKQKDAAETPATTFELEVVGLGTGEDGEEITSCVIVPTAGEHAGGVGEMIAAQGNGKWQRVGAEVLRDCVAVQQRVDPGRHVFGIGKKEFTSDLELQGVPKSTRYRLPEHLQKAGVISELNSLVWVINRDALNAALGAV